MFATAIIVFREVLEAALIIGILAAATLSVPNRNRWLAAGLVLGLVGSAVVAASTEAIASFASGIGQELFNAIVLGIAVVMLAWHNVWMAVHGAEMASQARDVGAKINTGISEASILLVIVGLAVLREGSETVLFLYGVVASGGASTFSMLIGGLIGMLIATLMGYGIYAGLLRVPMRWFFSATSVLVMLLAAGMASQAAKFLIQADLIPAFGNQIWDTSNIVSEKSITGMLLHNLVGYDAHPAGMQVLFYVAILAIIGIGMKLVSQKAFSKKSTGVVLSA
jgi:high-affinity iron transporter